MTTSSRNSMLEEVKQDSEQVAREAAGAAA